MLLRGNFPYQVDDRNRVPIPPRFRNIFGPEVLLVKAPDPCIQVFTEEAWALEAEALEGLAPHSEEARKTFRDFYGNTLDVPKDAQGRVVLPADLRRHAGIKDKGEVMVVGVKDRLEIWDRTTFEANSDDFAQARHHALERLSTDIERERLRDREGPR